MLARPFLETPGHICSIPHVQCRQGKSFTAKRGAQPSNGLTGIAGILGWGMHGPEAGSKGLDVSLGSGLGIS